MGFLDQAGVADMKKPKKRATRRKKIVPPGLAKQLWGESGFSETAEQERQRLLTLIATLERQRDDALQALSNRANIRKTVGMLDAVVASVNGAITELQRSAKNLRTAWQLVQMETEE